MSFKEVGAVLGISEGAAKVRAHRALAEIRESMGITGVGR
jgi:DNA-directed RNA polymerase specialized sigma24 family protein